MCHRHKWVDITAMSALAAFELCLLPSAHNGPPGGHRPLTAGWAGQSLSWEGGT